MEANIRALSDDRLLHDLREKNQCERDLVTGILRHLAEVERRRLHLARGYSSLFAFCLGELKYSENQAHTRIQAMRLLKLVPEAEAKIESGELSLSVVAAAQSSFRRSFKANSAVPVEKKRAVLAKLSNLSVRKAEQVLLEAMPVTAVPAERTKPVTAELTRIEFNAGADLMAKFERLKGLTAHKNFDGNWEKFFEILADVGLRELEPKRSEEARPTKARQKSLWTSKVTASRYLPANVRRRVWHRDQGKCTFEDPMTGKRCDSIHGLQFDHIHPFSAGGEQTVENLRLLCGAHNRWRSDPASKPPGRFTLDVRSQPTLADWADC